MVTVKAVKHADIRGKELMYLVATNGTTEVVVNVGEKTYNAVKELEANQHEKRFQSTQTATTPEELNKKLKK